MIRGAAAIALALALLVPSAALARKPLSAKDMKTIRKDARAQAGTLEGGYDAAGSTVTCRRRGPYAARCRIRLVDALGDAGRRHDCTVVLVYVVTRSRSIAGNLAGDGCA